MEQRTKTINENGGLSYLSSSTFGLLAKFLQQLVDRNGAIAAINIVTLCKKRTWA